jgi:hypothetical protein
MRKRAEGGTTVFNDNTSVSIVRDNNSQSPQKDKVVPAVTDS